MTPFFRLHTGETREGPGEAGDVLWAAGVAGVARDARICDAGCGPGFDIPALRSVAPEGAVVAIDKRFAEQARVHESPSVHVIDGDMATLPGPFDFIWSAGALYLLGVTEGLSGWRSALTPDGAVAFSHPCLFQEAEGARAFWGDYPVQSAAAIRAEIAAAGFQVLDARALSDTAWESYYTPLEARMEAFKNDPEMAETIAETRAEIDGWRQWKRHTGYMLFVVRPL